MSKELDRRHFLGGVAAGTAALTVGAEALGQPRPGTPAPDFRANPPAGFTPVTLPGRVVRVNKPNVMRPGNLYPRQEAAREMVHRAVMELSGRPDVASAFRAFVHPQDRVMVKVNGLGLRNMASNRETIVAVVEGVIAAGVPANQVSVLDQWDGFLSATRISASALPRGVRLVTHRNELVSPQTRVPSGRTWFALGLLEATAVIGIPLIKDHSLSGFTGAMKNLTHGCVKNPEDFHRHLCSPQIAELYAHDAIRSRTRLHVMDGFKAVYNGGPRDNPAAREVLGAVFAATDPVAIDRVGADIVDELRRAHHMTTLEQRGKPPRYLDVAATMGLGVADRARIQLQTVNLT